MPETCLYQIVRGAHQLIHHAHWSRNATAGTLPKQKYFDHPDYAHIAQMWDSTKNEGKTPADYKHKSTKMVWLKCSACSKCGQVHQWQASVNKLTTAQNKKVGCPWCNSYGRKHTFCQCRSIEDNPRSGKTTVHLHYLQYFPVVIPLMWFTPHKASFYYVSFWLDRQ